MHIERRTVVAGNALDAWRAFYFRRGRRDGAAPK
jgi:hypothetical protein